MARNASKKTCRVLLLLRSSGALDEEQLEGCSAGLVSIGRCSHFALSDPKLAQYVQRHYVAAP